ncbi:DUF4394 domain-containing protein [Sphingomonas profundi]|uniref:DUF4394 domain-containing protein n=1 Tax=Alterirhizorhabdus profundi TaxID=2681549 RepID=UPI0012E743A3|nr:DUF4394 domain-containing protein [Sphingomonas profundi]
MRNLILAATAIASLGAPASAASIYGVNEMNELVRFDSASPSTIQSRMKITGITDAVKAIDFRLADGALYGLTTNLSLVKIGLNGAAQRIGSPLALDGTEFGFDFNQSIDRIRVVSNANDNYVLNPDTGAIQLIATDVSYGNGLEPDVVASAYTPSVFGGPTQLYGIDTANDLLVTQANNAGTLASVGALGVDLNSRTSFDIARNGVGYVLDATNLYSVNLASGQLTSLGSVGETLYGISVADGISIVPEPGTWAMMLGGFGLIGGTLRRRRAERKAAIA